MAAWNGTSKLTWWEWIRYKIVDRCPICEKWKSDNMARRAIDSNYLLYPHAGWITSCYDCYRKVWDETQSWR